MTLQKTGAPERKAAGAGEGGVGSPSGNGGVNAGSVDGSNGPVVLLNEKKKKKKRYSSSLVKRAAKGTEGHTKALHRVVRAADLGIANWRVNWEKSSTKRRDGGLRDVMRNRAKAVSKFIQKASKAPSDVAKAERRPPTVRRGFNPPFAFMPAGAPVMMAVRNALPGPKPPLGPLGPLALIAAPGPLMNPAVLGAVATAVGTALGGRGGSSFRGQSGTVTALAPVALAAIGAALAPKPPLPPPPVVLFALSPMSPLSGGPLKALAGPPGPIPPFLRP